jgi:hypothetical protein
MSGLYAYVMKITLTNIEKLLEKVNTNDTGTYSKEPQLIAVLEERIGSIIGDSFIHISEFVVAKVKGLLPELDGHKEITDELFLRLPELIGNPFKIIVDIRAERKFLFISISPRAEIVVEVRRFESGLSEINTFHFIGLDELKRLERKFPVVYSESAETPSSSDASGPFSR